jgi:hypothetical protein
MRITQVMVEVRVNGELRGYMLYETALDIYDPFQTRFNLSLSFYGK